MDFFEESNKLHEKLKGKFETIPKISLSEGDNLSLAYTPGVAQPCKDIYHNPQKIYDYTIKSNTVAVISDGSAVLGLGNIGAEASMPVMEGKCTIFKEFAGINAFPIVLNTQDTQEIIDTIKNLSPTIGGINLEDISAPKCFEVEETLKKELDIPVFHDDQHGTAVITLAGLINAMKLTNRKKENTKLVINGMGAAGVAITKLLISFGIENIITVDSKGIISKERTDLNETKQEIAKITNPENIEGDLSYALKNSDVFIGVSQPNLLDSYMISTMNPDSIIFAMSNPTPEIMPEEAYKGGAKIVATGRSDLPNQLNNLLVFPGVFKGALEKRVRDITNEMKINAAKALADYVEDLSEEKIIPHISDKNVANIIGKNIL